MANLIQPDKTRHKYVVGIDFGHGETSAAICEIEWGKSANQRLSEVTDIDIDYSARKKVIPSAICRLKDGRIYIGDEAFVHITDNEGIRIGFKKEPLSIEGKDEALMIEYMRAVYSKICENDDRLQEGNHIVYIARPSGWTDEHTKEIYRQMAISAGIPLAELTSESRAAIFYAKSPKVGFAKEIDKGAMVFDLGSSTLDFTYLSENDRAVDIGYNLGASLIDDAIYNRLLLTQKDVTDFIARYPEYEGTLKFKARQFKELAYSRSPELKTNDDFILKRIISETDAAYEEFGKTYVELEVRNLQELNDLIEEDKQYQEKLINALKEFKAKYISGKKLNGVFLTGGASRMNFIRTVVAEGTGLSIDDIKVDSDNPSLTISRGIALLGATDAITNVLVKELKDSIDTMFSASTLFDPLVIKLAEDIAKKAWEVVENSCNHWVKNGPGTDLDELKKKIEKNMKTFQANSLPGVINNTVQSFIKTEQDKVRKEMNAIISSYAPGREITMIGNVSIGRHEAITSSLHDMSAVINAISKSMEAIIADILWKALGAFLWGVFVIPYYILKSIFTNDESKRKDKAKNILDKQLSITYDVRNSILDNLRGNRTFKLQVTKALKSYFNNTIDSSLEKVRIPIE